jgi:hypothetical protein
MVNATIRENMEKFRNLDVKKKIVRRLVLTAFLVQLAIAGCCFAQMGVATGNGVAMPAKPLPAGTQPPVATAPGDSKRCSTAGYAHRRR